MNDVAPDPVPDRGIERRDLLKGAAVAAAAVPLASLLSTPAAAAPPTTARHRPPGFPDGIPLRWLEGAPAESPGSTWGVPWPRGAFRGRPLFSLSTAEGTRVPVQSWPIAYWPDGTLKWSAHAVPPGVTAEQLVLTPGPPATPTHRVRVRDRAPHVEVDTGVIKARIPKQGTDLVSHIWRGNTKVAGNGRLVNVVQPDLVDGDEGTLARHRLVSNVDSVTVEQSGPVRAVVKVEGTHQGQVGGEETSWLPFTVRLYFYAGAESIRMVHSFVYDSDGHGKYLAGLGVRFSVPLPDAPYDRHVRLVGEGHGMLHEGVQGLTGLRRDPGEEVRAAQVAGEKTPDIADWPGAQVRDGLHWIPQFGDYTLSQLSANGFTVRKRTKAGHGWVPVDQGKRAAGLGYLGGPSGGLAFGMRDFWQRHPTQLDIRGAHTDEAEVTVWLYSPEAQPMDTRFYHDGLGQETWQQQLDALNITYEDYEPGYGTPYGIARTTELLFWAVGSTPNAERLGAMADAVRTPPQVIAPPEYTSTTGVFGGFFAPVDRSHPAKAAIEDTLDFLFDYYRSAQDQRHWYGFWDYGDIMHSQEVDRKIWRYDVGGHAWANSELSPDLWLWFAYLRSGRADIFRFAEAMTRHTGEVDQYHLGPWQGLGTRHNVQHWGDSAKQVRISNANYRRYFYYLTADERTGDLLRELVDSEAAFLEVDPVRKVRSLDPNLDDDYVPDPTALDIGFGTDWGSLAAAWLTEWERKGPKWKDARAKLLGTMESIAAQPNGFIQGGGLYNMETKRFAVATQPLVRISHLSAVFGLIEVNAELIDLIDMPEFEAAWLQYARLYNATAEEQEAEVGESWNRLLKQGHTRMDAYVAVRTGDLSYAQRAWQIFHDPPTQWEIAPDWDFTTERIETTLNPTDWREWVATNDASMYGLAAIHNLALIGDHIPD